MKAIVTTIATATIEETWTVELTPSQFRAIQRNAWEFLDMLAEEKVNVIDVTDKTVGDEEDREVTSATAWLP